MGEVIISPLLQVIFEKLASSLLTKLELSIDYKKEIDKLKSKLPAIQAVIEDAEEQQKDKKVKVWLNQLKEVAFDIDDLLDKLSTRILAKKIKKNKVWVSCLALKPFSGYHVMPRKLKMIRERVDELATDMSQFPFRERKVYERSLTAERRETGPHVDESLVVGRGEDLDAIVNLLVLTNENSQMNVSIIPILGMGGIGKTTLAQLVYNDARVKGHFDLRMWVSVYDYINVRKIMNEVLDYATKNKHELLQIGVLQSKLFESLCGKRYLLVLDDVWNDDQDEWEKLKLPLRGGANGSKIIITTRSEKVASIMGTVKNYELEGLEADECWTLFDQHAFSGKGKEEENYAKLMPIGRRIVQKCGGVPLAAKILGSLMRFKREESEWLHVQESELWNLHEEENKILSALRLSYNHLPSHLKRCFTYCSTFPKKFEITKEKLIHLWIAEGLIQSPGDKYATKKMEDTGSEYFNDLLLMSFFQAVNMTDESNKLVFKMHDLILDLAKVLAEDEFFTLAQEDAPINHAHGHFSKVHAQNHAQIRHASVFCNFKSFWMPGELSAARKLRSFRFFSPGNDSQKVIRSAISVFRRLRVLDLSGCGIRRLHKSVGSLIQLRYLDLSDTLVETLPKSVGHLYNLQILNLSGCHSLVYLPKQVSKLINLRHLMVKDCIRLTHMPPVKRLLNLQTLPLFIVGMKFEESLFQLVHLNLRGELSIKHLERAVSAVPDLCLEQKQLHSLRLSWGNDEAKSDFSATRTVERHDNDNDYSSAEAQLNCLKPNESLRKLHLNGYSGMVFPHWMDRIRLPSLTELELINCKSCRKLPALGQLPCLKRLSIQGLEGVVNLASEFYGEIGKNILFPSLNQLILKNLPNLETWESPDLVVALPCLDQLTIIKCPGLITMPQFPSLRYLELRNSNAMILRSAAVLSSLHTLIIDVFPELHHLPGGILQNNTDLESLTISSCPQLNSLPWDLRNLVALKSLTLRWCEELSSLSREIRNLTSLESLEITECHKLSSLPDEGIQGLLSLRSLSIENCCSLTCLPKGIKFLNALERLTIMYCPSLVDLPEEIQYLFELRNLTLMSCEKLTSLPEGLQQVKTLQNLEIRTCSNLVELPEWVGNLVYLRSLTICDCPKIKSLPEGLKRLKELQHISIRDSPHLEQRCQKEKGEDWFKISHVTYIYVGSSA